MQYYINDKQKEFLKVVLNNLSLKVLDECEDAEQLTQELKAKFNKKKIDKKAKLPSDSFYDKDGKELGFSPREDNGAIIVKTNKTHFVNPNKEPFRYQWKMDEFIRLVNFLHSYAVFVGEQDYEPYFAPYSEVIHVYKDGVERSIDIERNKWRYECFTDDNHDNHWTYLTPSSVVEVLRLHVGYIFLQEDVEAYLSELDEDIQAKYIFWKIKYEEEKQEKQGI